MAREGAAIMAEVLASPCEMLIDGAEIGPSQRSYRPVKVLTNRGSIFLRQYPVSGAKTGVLWLTGAGGGWSSPAKEVYPRLCRGLAAGGITSLQLCYRCPNNLQECVLDALAGVAYLQNEGVTGVALVGRSCGGAVAIHAAAASPAVRTLIALATQSSGTAPIARLRSYCSTLLIHGKEDSLLPASCSEYVYERAHDPKKLMLMEGAGHSLDEVAAVIYRTLLEWIETNLAQEQEFGTIRQ